MAEKTKGTRNPDRRCGKAAKKHGAARGSRPARTDAVALVIAGKGLARVWANRASENRRTSSKPRAAR